MPPEGTLRALVSKQIPSKRRISFSLRERERERERERVRESVCVFPFSLVLSAKKLSLTAFSSLRSKDAGQKGLKLWPHESCH